MLLLRTHFSTMSQQFCNIISQCFWMFAFWVLWCVGFGPRVVKVWKRQRHNKRIMRLEKQKTHTCLLAKREESGGNWRCIVEYMWTLRHNAALMLSIYQNNIPLLFSYHRDVFRSLRILADQIFDLLIWAAITTGPRFAFRITSRQILWESQRT